MRSIKNHIIILTIICFSVLTLIACYKSKVPISKPEIKIDKRILGTWYGNKNKKYRAKSTYYVIKKLNAKQYLIKIFKWNYSKKMYRAPEIYHAHLSMVKKQQFLNMQKQNTYDKKFGINSLSVHSKTHIEIIPLSGNIKEQFNKPVELKQFVKKYMHLSFFYEKNTRKLYR